MNTPLIIKLGLFGVIMGVASLFGGTRGIEALCWAIILLYSAWLIGKRASARPFLHGLYSGGLAALMHSLIQVAFMNTYLAHNSEAANQSEIPGGLSICVFYLLIAPVIAVIAGSVLGLFSLGAFKLMHRK